jgi:hypothetical protein
MSGLMGFISIFDWMKIVPVCSRRLGLPQDNLSTSSPDVSGSYNTVDSLLIHRMGPPRPMPPFYSQPVQPLFDKWLSLFLDVQNKANYRIPDPVNKEMVYAYLERLQSIVIDQKERRKIWLERKIDPATSTGENKQQGIPNFSKITPRYPSFWRECRIH